MSYKKMFHTMLMKARYSWKSYLFFVILTFLFIVMYIMTLIFEDPTEILHSSSMAIITFMYIPVLINQAVQSMEYSKIYYLVPRTSEMRKKFIIFENVVKFTISTITSTIIYIIGILIQPIVWKYLLAWYLMSSIGFGLIAGTNGYGSYYLSKKRLSFKWIKAGYIVSIIIMSGFMLGGMFAFDERNLDTWFMVSVVSVVASLIYHMYYFIRFLAVNTDYENINIEEKRLSTRTGNCVS